MEHEFGKIPPLFLVAYVAACWVGWGCYFLWQECRREGFVSWGTLLVAGFIMPPLMSVFMPCIATMGAMFAALMGFEKSFGWIVELLRPLFRPIGLWLSALGSAIRRKLGAKAFSCNSLKP